MKDDAARGLKVNIFCCWMAQQWQTICHLPNFYPKVLVEILKTNLFGDEPQQGVRVVVVLGGLEEVHARRAHHVAEGREGAVRFLHSRRPVRLEQVGGLHLGEHVECAV